MTTLFCVDDDDLSVEVHAAKPPAWHLEQRQPTTAEKFLSAAKDLSLLSGDVVVLLDLHFSEVPEWSELPDEGARLAVETMDLRPDVLERSRYGFYLFFILLKNEEWTGLCATASSTGARTGFEAALSVAPIASALRTNRRRSWACIDGTVAQRGATEVLLKAVELHGQTCHRVLSKWLEAARPNWFGGDENAMVENAHLKLPALLPHAMPITPLGVMLWDAGTATFLAEFWRADLRDVDSWIKSLTPTVKAVLHEGLKRLVGAYAFLATGDASHHWPNLCTLLLLCLEKAPCPLSLMKTVSMAASAGEWKPAVTPERVTFVYVLESLFDAVVRDKDNRQVCTITTIELPATGGRAAATMKIGFAFEVEKLRKSGGDAGRAYRDLSAAVGPDKINTDKGDIVFTL